MEKIYIKNMVCPRCIMSVREIFRKNGIEPAGVELGVVTLDSDIPETASYVSDTATRLTQEGARHHLAANAQTFATGDEDPAAGLSAGSGTEETCTGNDMYARMRKIRHDLEGCGFEIIDDRKMQTVERIRTGVIEYVRGPEIGEGVKLSEFLQKKCLKEYSALSKLFTEMKGMTIEKYCILQKAEYIKELLFYGELNISEIADLLHYSSTAHLSAQFKSVTGLTPSQFRRLKSPGLSPIDGI